MALNVGLCGSFDKVEDCRAIREKGREANNMISYVTTDEEPG
jgi:hypothetical protein